MWAKRGLFVLAAVLGALLIGAPMTAQIGIPLARPASPVNVYPGSAVNGGGTIGRALLFSPDATFDIGANGASRPANIWVSGQVNAGTISVLNTNAGKFAWGNGNAWASNATPTISSGFGTSPTITGAASVFRVTLGNPVGQSGVVLFNLSVAFGSAPFVSCRDETTNAANPPAYATTATQVTITFTTAVAADTVVCSVQGLP